MLFDLFITGIQQNSLWEHGNFFMAEFIVIGSKQRMKNSASKFLPFTIILHPLMSRPYSVNTSSDVIAKPFVNDINFFLALVYNRTACFRQGWCCCKTGTFNVYVFCIETPKYIETPRCDSSIECHACGIYMYHICSC